MNRITVFDDETNIIVSLVLFCVWCLVEWTRVFSGYYGNLRESVNSPLNTVP